MTLNSLSNSELITSFEKAVSSERKITHLVLQHILEIESRRIYADLGYDSLFSYLTQKHGYCESSAYTRIQSARLLKQVPDVVQKLESGTLKLSQLAKVQKHLKAESKQGQSLSTQETQNLLKKIENKNGFETERILAFELNLPIKSYEVIKPQKDESVRLELTLSSEEFEILKKAKDLLSHTCPDGSWTQVITTLASKYTQSKAGKISTSDTDTNTTHSFAVKEANTQKYRPHVLASTRRQLMQKAQNSCEYRNHKKHKRCGSTYQLQIDHIKPLTMGGSHDIANLRVLCRTHNILMAERSGLDSYKV